MASIGRVLIVAIMNGARKEKPIQGRHQIPGASPRSANVSGVYQPFCPCGARPAGHRPAIHGAEQWEAGGLQCLHENKGMEKQRHATQGEKRIDRCGLPGRNQNRHEAKPRGLVCNHLADAGLDAGNGHPAQRIRTRPVCKERPIANACENAGLIPCDGITKAAIVPAYGIEAAPAIPCGGVIGEFFGNPLSRVAGTI